MNRFTDPTISQLLQQMKQMEEKITGLTLTNHTLQQDKKGLKWKSGCEPKDCITLKKVMLDLQMLCSLG